MNGCEQKLKPEKLTDQIVPDEFRRVSDLLGKALEFPSAGLAALGGSLIAFLDNIPVNIAHDLVATLRESFLSRQLLQAILISIFKIGLRSNQIVGLSVLDKLNTDVQQMYCSTHVTLFESLQENPYGHSICKETRKSLCYLRDNCWGQPNCRIMVMCLDKLNQFRFSHAYTNKVSRSNVPLEWLVNVEKAFRRDPILSHYVSNEHTLRFGATHRARYFFILMTWNRRIHYLSEDVCLHCFKNFGVNCAIVSRIEISPCAPL